MQTATKIPVNGGSRPWKTIPERVTWQEYEAAKLQHVPDMDSDEPDAYISKTHNWDIVHEP